MFFDESFRFSWLDRTQTFPSWNFAMVKERATARQLAEMITEKIGASGLEIVVRWDHAYGWQPNVIDSPGDRIGYQRRAEEIANRLRFQFDLRE